MILYNVTIKIDSNSKEEWLEWMNKFHIPDVMATGYFSKYQLARVITMDENEGHTYAIQYHCKDMSTLHQYQINEAARLQAEHTEKFKDKFVAFRTLLEILAPEGV